MNNLLAILIVAAAFIGTWGNNRNVTIGALAVIGAIMLFVCATAAQVNDFGPMLGIGAFVGTFALIYFFRKR